MNIIEKEAALALFAEADEYNWDDGLVRIKEILADKNCELGTASLVYWRAQPTYYKKYNTREEAQSYELEAFDLIVDIEKRVAANEFPVQYVSFDPHADQVIDDQDPATKKIPEKLLQAVVAVSE